jgi:hypothetical protein
MAQAANLDDDRLVLRQDAIRVTQEHPQQPALGAAQCHDDAIRRGMVAGGDIQRPAGESIGIAQQPADLRLVADNQDAILRGHGGYIPQPSRAGTKYCIAV